MKKIFFVLILSLSLNNSNAETYSKSEVFELIRGGKFTEKISSRLPACLNEIKVSERINCWGADKNETRMTISEYGNVKGKREGFGLTKTKNVFLQGVIKNDKYIYGSYKDLKTNGIYEGSFNAKGKFEGEGIFMFFNENNQITMQINGTWKNHLLEGPAKYCNLTKSSNKLDCNQVNFINGKIVK
tara:strand:- start:850 stop:1407 length:558 start_codon:yes stop_codon:yes gene_type:complete